MEQPDASEPAIRPDDPVDQATEYPDAASDHAAPVSEASVSADDGQGHESDEEDAAAPLEPGGKRFKQVYARAKAAEAQLQTEREARARVEGQLEATRIAAPVAEPKPEVRHTWTQLDAAIEEGKITRAQAMEYDRETIKQELGRDFEARLQQERTSREHTSTVQTQLTDYKAIVPEILTPGTPERIKLQAEFDYLVRLGYDAKDPRTDLLALRTTFGDVKVAKERRDARTSIKERETMQDIPANGKGKPDAKDPLKTITPEQKKYYQRMIDRGEYKGWAAVREELIFVPPR